MIGYLHIDGFKGFNNFDLSGLSKINLLYGLNNSGKTSILEAIGFGVNPCYTTCEYLEYKYSQSYDIFNTLNHFFVQPVAISINTEKNTLQISNYLTQVELTPQHLPSLKNKIALTIPLKVFTANGKHIYFNGFSEAIDHAIKQLTLTLGVEILKDKQQVINSVNNILTENVEKKSIPCSFPDIYFFHDAIHQNHLTNQDFFNSVLEKKALKSQLLDILQTVDNTIVDYFFNSTGNLRFKVLHSEESRPVEYMGDGLKKIFNLLNVLFASGAKTVMIDELDNGLHPLSYYKIFTLLHELSVQKGIQFFITSHNPEFVNNLATFSIETKTENTVCFFNIQKNKKDEHWVTAHEAQYMNKLLTEQHLKLRW